MKIPPQILRLLLVTVVIAGTYAVARVLLTPASFGEYGHYRGAALEEIASRPRSYAGMKACDECHSDTLATLAKGAHAAVSCEACHGPALAHADNPDATLAKHTDALCLRCHEASPSRPAWLKQINVKTHYGTGCTGCHLPHQPNQSPP